MKKINFFLIFLLIVIIVIFLLVFFKTNEFCQISNKKNILLPVLNPYEKRYFNFSSLNNNDLTYLNNYFNFFEVRKNELILNFKGIYEIIFTISGSKRIEYLPPVDPEIIEDEDYYVDSHIEWSLNNIKIPVYSQNRTTGPENVNHITKILKIEKVPYKISLTYSNLDFRSVSNYILDNFIFIIKKIS